MLAHFGAEDTFKGFSDAATAAKLRDTMSAAGAGPLELHVHAGAGHAFMNALTADGRAKIKGAFCFVVVLCVSVCAATCAAALTPPTDRPK